MVRSNDFEFWEEGSKSSADPGGNLRQFQIERCAEDQFTVCTPSWWKQAPIDHMPEASPLLSCNRNDSCYSPSSRRRAIIDGRRELMEMINDMPESSFELSLRDIVDDLQNEGQIQEKEVLVEEKKVQPKREIPKRSQNSRFRGNQISRAESMETEIFMLKMFLPSSLSSKKRSTATRPKIYPVPSSKESKNRGSKDWWKMIFQSVKDNRKTAIISRSQSDVSNYRSSTVEGNILPCQRSLSEKCKSRQQRGCLF